jgi:hypothetical protein
MQKNPLNDDSQHQRTCPAGRPSKDTRLTMHAVGIPFYGYPIAGAGVVIPSDVWEFLYPEFTTQGGTSFLYGNYQSPESSLQGAHPAYWNGISGGAWYEDTGPSRYGTYPGHSAHLTTSISTLVSQVSCPHPSWRFVAIQSARHAGLT